MNFSTLSALCDATVRLLSPLVEIVIHNIHKGTIVYIQGNLSNRSLGDPSFIEGSKLSDKDLQPVTYPKLNFDGRLVKSISVPIEEQWLVCINCDVSIFKEIEHLSTQLLATDAIGPAQLFKDDYKDRLNKTIHGYLTEKKWSFPDLKLAQKKEVIHYLFLSGAFREKNAVPYIAQVLSMGRATIFNYLKEWRATDENL